MMDTILNLGLTPDDDRSVRRRVPCAARGDVPPDRRRRRPRRPVGAAPAGDRGGLPLVERRPGAGVSREGGDRGRPRHGRRRAGDGLRQPRPGFRDRRAVHAQPGDRRAGALRRRHVRRAGRGRRRRDACDRTDLRARRAHARRRRGAAGPRRPARAPLRRHVRHRVHDRGRPAVAAPGPGRQAQPAGRAADRGRHGGRRVRSRCRGPMPWNVFGRCSPTRPFARRAGAASFARSSRACPPRRGPPAARSPRRPKPPSKPPRQAAPSSSSARRPRPTTSTAWPGQPGS